MKNKIILFGLLCTLVIIVDSVHCIAQDVQKIRVVFGTRCKRYNDGCSGDKGICLFISNSEKAGAGSYGTAEVSIVSGQIKMDIIQDSSPATDLEKIFYLYTTKSLPAEVCNYLGYKSIVLQPGEYRIDKTRYPLGSILIRAELQK